jgi:hypothetical protein
MAYGIAAAGTALRVHTSDHGTDLPGGLGDDYTSPAEVYRPLGGYAILTALFGAAFGASLLEARRSGRTLPSLGAGDIVLTGLATHKLSRLLTKDKVTSFLRAPFTEYQEGAGHGELEEKARGRGLRLATGELLVCPYCIAQWVAGGFVAGQVFAPRVTRLLTAMWTAQAVADAAQLAYSAAEQRS